MRKRFIKISSLLTKRRIYSIVFAAVFVAGGILKYTNLIQIDNSNKLVSIGVPKAGAWYSGYGYRKQLVLDEALITGTTNLTNFPILISMTDTSLRTVANGGRVTNANGYDIIFTDTGDTKLDHQLESYNATTGEIIAWVRIPTLSYSADTTINMYYGNAGIGSSQNLTSTWVSGYKGVWHLNDGSNATVADSTSFSNTFTKRTTTGPANATGKIGSAQQWNGTSDYASLTDNANISPTVASNTFSVWVNITAFPAGSPYFMQLLGDDSSANTPSAIWRFGASNQSANNKRMGINYNDGSNHDNASGTDLTTATWTHIVVTTDGTNVRYYINGALITTTAYTYTPRAITQTWYMGAYGTTARFFKGIMDEMRIYYGAALSADWIQAEYANQNNTGVGGGKFIQSVGGEEVDNTPPTFNVQPSAGYNSYSRTGSANTPWVLSFTGVDAQQTGGNALTYSLKRSSDNAVISGGTGTFTSSAAQNINLAYNATNLTNGSNTLYVQISDGTYNTNSNTFSLLRDDVDPTAATSISTNPGTLTNGTYTVTFTPNDATSTGSNEMSWQIRTQSGGGGTLLSSGTRNATSGSPKTSGSINDTAIVNGSNQRWIRTCDGAINCIDTQFTVTAALLPSGVDTSAAANVNSFYVTLKGSANPNGVQTYGHFRIFTTNPGNCNSDSGGWGRFPELQANDMNLGSGSATVTDPTFQFTIPFNSSSFLVPNTQYWYCAYAIGSNGTGGASTVQSFTTADGQSSPCDPPTSGNITIPAGAACTFNGTISGTDSGSGTANTSTLTLGSNVALIVGAGQQVARGSLTKSAGSKVTLAQGGTLIKGAVFIHDKDGDGVVDSGTKFIGATSSASTEFVRRNSLSTTYNYAWKLASSSAVFDCNPNSAYVNKIIPALAIVTDADNDGYKTSAGAATNVCVGNQSTINGRTYFKDASNVSSFLPDGQKLSSSTDCQDNPSAAPCAPVNSSGTSGTNPAGAGSSSTQVDLSWGVNTLGGAVPAVTSYDVQICGLGDSTCASVDSTQNVSSGTFAYNNSSITCSATPYYYRIVANNTTNGNTSSNIFSGTTTACVAAPSITAMSISSITNNSAQFNSSVNGNGAAATITYRYSTSNSACNALGTTFAGTQSGFTSGVSDSTNRSTSINGNTTYYYCATSTNSQGTTNGVTNNNANSSFLTRPNAPTSPTATGTTATQINVAWTNPSGGATSYNLKWCRGASCTPAVNGTSNQYGTINGVSSTYSHTSLAGCGETYRYYVTAVNATGTTDSSLFSGSTTSCYSESYYQAYYYGQGYYQGFYQVYYQPYYEGYYQPYYEPYY